MNSNETALQCSLCKRKHLENGVEVHTNRIHKELDDVEKLKKAKVPLQDIDYDDLEYTLCETCSDHVFGIF